MLRWLVSKRLAFALVIVLGLLSVFYILFFSPVSAMLSASSPSLPSFRYNACLLYTSGPCASTPEGSAREGTFAAGHAAGSTLLPGLRDAGARDHQKLI